MFKRLFRKDAHKANKGKSAVPTAPLNLEKKPNKNRKEDTDPKAKESDLPQETPAKESEHLNASKLYEKRKTEAINIGNQLFPEDLCGIDPNSDLETIKEKLAFLYRRYNRAASSLDKELQSEAGMMLEAIVDVRHKFFGP